MKTGQQYFYTFKKYSSANKSNRTQEHLLIAIVFDYEKLTIMKSSMCASTS